MQAYFSKFQSSLRCIVHFNYVSRRRKSSVLVLSRRSYKRGRQPNLSLARRFSPKFSSNNSKGGNEVTINACIAQGTGSIDLPLYLIQINFLEIDKFAFCYSYSAFWMCRFGLSNRDFGNQNLQLRAQQQASRGDRPHLKNVVILWWFWPVSQNLQFCFQTDNSITLCGSLCALILARIWEQFEQYR